MSDIQEPTSTSGQELWRATPCGGCARKVSPEMAQRLARLGKVEDFSSFMGDVAVVEPSVGQSLALTIDFITPVVPSPGDYGRIAAANALSDAYVAGAVPRFALGVACVPPGAAAEDFALAFEAAAAYLAEAGCVLVGGHSVVDPEPKLGFAVVAVPNSSGRLLAAGARPDDVLVLTKPLGVGVLTSAFRAGMIAEAALRPAVDSMVASNAFVIPVLQSPLGAGIHCATDVTGYGLLGHLKELCVRSGVGAEISCAALPVLPGVVELAATGTSTSAFATNAQYVAEECGDALQARTLAEQIILTDPQTSGGVLLAVAGDQVDDLLAVLPDKAGSACVIGRVTDRPGQIGIVD